MMPEPHVKLYDAAGRVKTVREPWMVEFDRKFRQQMGDNGGQFFSRSFIEATKKNIEIREREHEEALRKFDDGRGILDQIVSEMEDAR